MGLGGLAGAGPLPKQKPTSSQRGEGDRAHAQVNGLLWPCTSELETHLPMGSRADPAAAQVLRLAASEAFGLGLRQAPGNPRPSAGQGRFEASQLPRWRERVLPISPPHGVTYTSY